MHFVVSENFFFVIKHKKKFFMLLVKIKNHINFKSRDLFIFCTVFFLYFSYFRPFQAGVNIPRFITRSRYKYNTIIYKSTVQKIILCEKKMGELTN